jgi:hypothetical protein
MKPTVEQNQHERDGTEPKRESIVLEGDAPDAFGPGQDADQHERQGDRHRESLGKAAEDDAQRQQYTERREKQSGRQRFGARHSLLVAVVEVCPRSHSRGAFPECEYGQPRDLRPSGLLRIGVHQPAQVLVARRLP